MVPGETSLTGHCCLRPELQILSGFRVASREVFHCVRVTDLRRFSLGELGEFGAGHVQPLRPDLRDDPLNPHAVFQAIPLKAENLDTSCSHGENLAKPVILVKIDFGWCYTARMEYRCGPCDCALTQITGTIWRCPKCRLAMFEMTWTELPLDEMRPTLTTTKERFAPFDDAKFLRWLGIAPL